MIIKITILCAFLGLNSLAVWDYVETNRIYNNQVCKIMAIQSGMALQAQFDGLKHKLANMKAENIIELVIFTNWIADVIVYNYNDTMLQECINMQTTPLQHYFRTLFSEKK